MTVIAFRAEFAVMHVVRAMTGPAGSRYIACAFGRRIGMAGITGKSGMRAVQREAGGSIVIECAGRPGVAGMAGAAIVTECAGMRIVVCVATAAVLRGPAEAVVGMTSGTGNRRMNAEQREFGQIVVEADRFRPGRLAMAIRTFARKHALVNVIECVTAVAGSRRRVLDSRLVAGRAIELCVCLFENEARVGVIEARCGPATRVVTVRTIRPQPALVRVVGRMAGRTTGGEIVAVIGSRMTVSALELRMTVLQCEACDASMVKSGALPGVGRVATAAIRSSLARVNIVHRVAACASRLCLVKTVALVAIPAGDCVVRAGQRIAGQ